MSVYKDNRILAEKCVTMVDACLKGTEPEVNDTEQQGDDVSSVRSYLCESQVVDKDNYNELLIESKYYSEDQLK